ncbi:ABC transporter permease [Agaricicola taiwanensis]|nr:iron ABC transporter permease [Agaricicola taiwanensis]
MAITLPSLSRSRLRAAPRLSGWIIASGAIACLIAAPIVTLAWIAAQGSGDLWPQLIAYVLPRAIRDTTILLAGVGTLTAVIGVGTAWLVTAYRFPGRGLFDWALLLPLAVPTYILAYAYLDLLHPLGPVQGLIRAMLGIESPVDFRLPDIRGMAGCIFLFGLAFYPYVYLTARAMFLMQSACVIEVARTLGCGGAGAFFRVALPLARPAVAVGVSLVLMETLNDLGASDLLGVQTLTVSIYSTWVNRSNLPGAAQIALVMLAVVIGLVILERAARRRQAYAAQAQRSRKTDPVRLTPGHAALAVVACALPILLGFAAPAGYLLRETFRRAQMNGFPPDVMQMAGNTMMFAAIATVITMGLGLLLAHTSRLVRRPLTRGLVQLSSIGYAVPGTVLAVGLLVPLANLDNSIDAFMRSHFGVATGLLISGSGAALIYAYAVRFMAISAGGIEAGFAKVPMSLDWAARNLGETAAGTARRIHLPLLRPAIGAAALLVFVDCMKELPATLLLRPFNFETLSTYVYAEASRGTYENGAFAALLIVAAGLFPVVLMARMSRPPAAEAFGGEEPDDQVVSSARPR